MTTKKKETDLNEELALNRANRIQEFAATGKAVRTVVAARSATKPRPVDVDQSRAKLPKRSWEPVEDRLVKDAGRVIEPASVSKKLEKNADYTGTYHRFSGALRPEYDMMEPFVIYDTEVFVKQMVTRKLALMFRNGFELVSDLDADGDQGQKNIDYIQRRLDVMEYVTSKPTENFLREILFNLLLCSNCFLRKIRDEKASPGLKNEKNKDREPIAGYTMIPAHEIQPYLVEGKITKWRRYFTSGTIYEDIPLHDIVHLKWDAKPGHIYGTPRTVGVRDDIFALRRLEENIELLFVNHLFPLFHVKVGSEKNPAWYGPNGESEIDIIKYQIETMPKEGVFVSDERCEVDAVGAQGQTLETTDLIAHLKGRVLTGLGVSPLDVGEGDTANRSTADNISQVLKDAIKADLDTFGGLFRMSFFKDWFEEANYSLSIQKAVTTTRLAFHEIDLDNKIKEENHTIQKYNSHLITEDEARKDLKKKPIDAKSRKNLHFDLHLVRLVKETANAKAEAETKMNKELLPLQAAHQEKLAETQKGLIAAQSKHAKIQAGAHEQKAAATVKVLHAKIKHAVATGAATPTAKSAQNKNTPTNQHGSNPGPTKAKSHNEFLTLLKDNLIEARKTSIEKGVLPEAVWKDLSSEVVEKTMAEMYGSEIDVPGENRYTNQLRIEEQKLKDLVGLTSDPELLAVLLDGDYQSYEDLLNVDGTEMEPSTEASERPEHRQQSSLDPGDPGSDIS